MKKLKASTMNNPCNSSEGWTIQPIDVIESWSLCHHLACTVKHIESASRTSPNREELKKAKWYLLREVRYLQESFGACSLSSRKIKGLAVKDVCINWQLSENLSDVLNHIRTSKVPSLRKESLREALKGLRAEIRRQEEEVRMSKRNLTYLVVIVVLMMVMVGDCLAATSTVDDAFKDIEGLLGGKLGAVVQVCAFAIGAGASIVASKIWPVACASLVLVGYNGFSSVIKSTHSFLI